jgi:hypothetical protein
MINYNWMTEARHSTHMWEKRNAYRVLVGKPEGKIPLGRHRHRWEDNIKMDLREIGWTGLIWLRIGTGNVVMNLQVL